MTARGINKKMGAEYIVHIRFRKYLGINGVQYFVGSHFKVDSYFSHQIFAYLYGTGMFITVLMKRTELKYYASSMQPVSSHSKNHFHIILLSTLISVS